VVAPSLRPDAREPITSQARRADETCRDRRAGATAQATTRS
jgi:hypothetical protein